MPLDFSTTKTDNHASEDERAVADEGAGFTHLLFGSPGVSFRKATVLQMHFCEANFPLIDAPYGVFPLTQYDKKDDIFVLGLTFIAYHWV